MKTDFLFELPLVVIQYVNYLSGVKNKSDLTISAYATDLRTFFRFMKINYGLVSRDADFEKISVKDINESFVKKITLNDAYAFLSYCNLERNNSAVTRARKVSSLKGFFRFCTIQLGLFTESPMRELDVPKIKKSLPKYLTLEQSISLLDSIDGKYKERDYCILTLFLNCGLRLSELVGLNCSDIKSNGTMVVTGKGNKERTIYLNDACNDAIKNYLRVRPVDGVKDKDALFISRLNKRISPKTVQLLVNNLLEKCGLKKQGISVHKLRHTAATLMYQYGHVDIVLLKEILGHESLSTTDIYTHVVNDQLKNAVAANPLSKQKQSKN